MTDTTDPRPRFAITADLGLCEHGEDQGIHCEEAQTPEMAAVTVTQIVMAYPELRWVAVIELTVRPGRDRPLPGRHLSPVPTAGDPLSTTSPPLRYACDACEKPVDPGCGYIHCDQRLVHDYRATRDEQETRIRATHDGLLVYSGPELAAIPEVPPWQVHHRACDPNPEGSDYWFDVGRADSATKMLDWTAHLLAKNWFSDTGWAEFLQDRVLAQLSDDPA